MKVVEQFVSINGESRRAGELAVFVRFKGCNLNCSYCDTKWANESECEYTEKTPEEIMADILATGIKNVTLTGGEPLLQKNIATLIDLIIEQGLRVEIETNGSVDISRFIPGENNSNLKHRPSFTMDYKSPSSGCEDKMLMSNYAYIDESDTVKFVVGSIEDLNKAKAIIDKYRLVEKCRIYISPIFGNIEPAEIVEYMIANKLNDVRLQIQMHKVIWDPNKRGV